MLSYKCRRRLYQAFAVGSATYYQVKRRVSDDGEWAQFEVLTRDGRWIDQDLLSSLDWVFSVRSFVSWVAADAEAQRHNIKKRGGMFA